MNRSLHAYACEGAHFLYIYIYGHILYLDIPRDIHPIFPCMGKIVKRVTIENGLTHTHAMEPSAALGDAAAAVSHRPQPLVPLSDEQVRQFVSTGALSIRPATLPHTFHERLLAKTRALHAEGAEDWQGNNCFPTNPLLGELLREPHVHGALTGLMGRSYALHPHRQEPSPVPRSEMADIRTIV